MNTMRATVFQGMNQFEVREVARPHAGPGQAVIRAPRHPNAKILDGSRIVLVSAQGCFIAAITIGAFVYLLYRLNVGLDQARTAAFTVLVVSHLVHAFNCRSNEESVFTLGLLSNKPLLWAVGGSILLQIVILSNANVREIFRAVPLAQENWVLVLGLGFLPLVVMEAWKWVRRLSGSDQARRVEH